METVQFFYSIVLSLSLLFLGNSHVLKFVHHGKYRIRKYLHRQLETSESLPHFVAGVIAGSAECLVGHPLETLRIMSMKKSIRSITLGSFMKIILESGGFIGLYRGSVSELISSALSSSYVYGANDVLKRLIGRSMEDDDFEKVDLKLLVSAFATGCLDVLITKPFEMIKLRQQASTSSMEAHASFLQRANSLMKEGGILNMYRGWVPTILRESIGSLAFFAVYQHIKNYLISYFQNGNNNILNQLDINNRNSNKKKTEFQSKIKSLQLLNIGANENKNQLSHFHSTIIILIAGGIAGLSYILISHPLDVLSVYMQIDMPTKTLISPVISDNLQTTFQNSKIFQSLSSSNIKYHYQYKYNDIIHCALDILKEEGVKGFFQGLNSAALRSIPTFAASFYGYECCLEYFEQSRKILVKKNHTLYQCQSEKLI